jgi:hypothetical protein
MKRNEFLYGTVAEFADPTSLVGAAKQVRELGYERFEVYSPYPIKALDKIVPSYNFVPLFTLTGGLLGAATAWSMQYYIAAIDYPINVGGRPLYSWPSFVPILFELTVLLSAGLCFFGTLGLCGFPKPHFALFNLPEFAKATSNRFFLCIESADPIYRAESVSDLLHSLDAIGVWEVEDE